MKPIVLIGGGGHARSIVEMLEGSVEIKGYADSAEGTADLMYLGTDQDVLRKYSPDDVDIHLGVGFDPDCGLSLRRKLSERFASYRQATLAAPSAWVSGNSCLAEGVTVMARAAVNRSRIGRSTVINTGAIIEHDCTVGENSFIGPGAIVCGGVTVGNDVFVGAGVIIRQGINICNGARIGMGSVVVKDITEPGLYVGNPARKLQREEK